jgi:hypothetical protein
MNRRAFLGSAIEALSLVERRCLWRALDDEELQDMYGRASEAGLDQVASRLWRPAATGHMQTTGKSLARFESSSCNVTGAAVKPAGRLRGNGQLS